MSALNYLVNQIMTRPRILEAWSERRKNWRSIGRAKRESIWGQWSDSFCVFFLNERLCIFYIYVFFYFTSCCTDSNTFVWINIILLSFCICMSHWLNHIKFVYILLFYSIWSFLLCVFLLDKFYNCIRLFSSQKLGG